MTVRLQARFIFTNFTKNQTDSSTDYLSLQPNSQFYTPFPCISDPNDNRKSQYDGNKKVHSWRRLGVYRDFKAQELFRQKGELSCAGYMNFLKEQVKDEDIAHFNNAAIV